MRFFITLATILFAAAGQGQSGEILTPDSIVTQTLASGREFLCTLVVPVGQAAEVSIIEKQAFAGIVEVHAEDGSETQADLSKRVPANKRLTLLAGRFEIRFVPANHSPLKRIFEIHTSAFHPATDADRSRAAAEMLLGEGEQAERKFGPGSQDEALGKYEAALAVWKSLDDKVWQADTLRHIGFTRQRRYESSIAGASFQHALDLSRAASDSDGMGWALIGLSSNKTDTGQANKGRELADQAREIMDANGDVRGQAWARMVRGGSINGASDVDKERANYVEALDLARRAGDRILEADAQNMLGVLEMRAGNFKAAGETYLQALAIDREEDDPVRVAQTLSNLGALHGSLGEFRESLNYLEQALPIRKDAGPWQYGNTAYNIAFDYAQLGEYEKALDEYSLALSLFRTATSPYGQAHALAGIADVHIALKDDEKAEGYLKQSLAIRRAIPDRQGEAVLLTRLGGIAIRRSQADEALRLYRQALAIDQVAGFVAGEVEARDYIAEILVLKDPRAALEELARGLEINRRLGNKPREALELYREGQVFRSLGERANARQVLQEALEIRHASGVAQLEAETLLELARLDCDEGHFREANDGIVAALDLFESLRSNIGSREARTRFASYYRGFYDLAIDVAMKLHDPAKALELSERARTRSLVELLSEAKIDLRQGVEPVLLAKERQVKELLDGKHDRFMRLLGSSHSPASEASGRKELDQLVERYQSIETEIRGRSPRYAAMARPQPVTVTEIQSRLLDPGAELVEFWLGENRSYAWIVSKEDCRGFELPARSVIETLARRAYNALAARNRPGAETLEQYGQRLTAARAEFAKTSDELSRMLLKPIAADLHARKLWIVSDGALQYLPFAALPLPGKTAPLVTVYEITALPSASALAAIRRDLDGRAPARKSVAIFADPVFRADDERLAARLPSGGRGSDVFRAAEESGVADLPRLKFSRAEATAIAALLPPGGTWQQFDFNASLADAKKPKLGRYGIVHFATHALLNSRHPELSGIVLSLVDRNGQPQDGFLRLHEIYDLKLNADLVVLSGCQTALGQEIRSEGLVGLTRGFMYAGSPQVLASLWSVRDSATAEFMRRFYEGVLRRHLAPAAALRETQLSIMQDPRWKDPYDWAAFTLQGTR